MGRDREFVSRNSRTAQEELLKFMEAFLLDPQDYSSLGLTRREHQELNSTYFIDKKITLDTLLSQLPTQSSMVDNPLQRRDLKDVGFLKEGLETIKPNIQSYGSNALESIRSLEEKAEFNDKKKRIENNHTLYLSLLEQYNHVLRLISEGKIEGDIISKITPLLHEIRQKLIEATICLKEGQLKQAKQKREYIEFLFRLLYKTIYDQFNERLDINKLELLLNKDSQSYYSLHPQIKSLLLLKTILFLNRIHKNGSSVSEKQLEIAMICYRLALDFSKMEQEWIKKDKERSSDSSKEIFLTCFYLSHFLDNLGNQFALINSDDSDENFRELQKNIESFLSYIKKLVTFAEINKFNSEYFNETKYNLKKQIEENLQRFKVQKVEEEKNDSV